MHRHRRSRRRLFHERPCSPPLFWRDVRHVRRTQAFDAFDRSERDIDSVMPQKEIHEWTRRTLPALDLVLAHTVDEVVLLGRGELGKFLAVERLAAPLHGPKRRAIKIDEWRTHTRDARHQQAIAHRHVKLMIDKARNPRLARPRK